MTDDRKSKVLRELGRLMAGLAVPVSLGTDLGAATEPWADLHHELAGFGWHNADDYERALREVIGIGTPAAPGDGDAAGKFRRGRQFLADQPPATYLIGRNLVREWLDAGAEAIAEAGAEIARLKAQLDRYEGRTVYHATEAAFSDAKKTLELDSTDLKAGDILRATDTGLENIWTGTEWTRREAGEIT